MVISQKNCDIWKGANYIFQFQQLKKYMVEFQFYRKYYEIILVM